MRFVEPIMGYDSPHTVKSYRLSTGILRVRNPQGLIIHRRIWVPELGDRVTSYGKVYYHRFPCIDLLVRDPTKSVTVPPVSELGHGNRP